MLLTHNDGRLARQVDKPRLVGAHFHSGLDSHLGLQRTVVRATIAMRNLPSHHGGS
jgi:hypothetical protein